MFFSFNCILVVMNQGDCERTKHPVFGWSRFISRQYASADSNHTVENVRSSYVGFDFTQIIPLAMKQILSSQDRFDRNSDFCYLIVALFLTNLGLIHMRYE